MWTQSAPVRALPRGGVRSRRDRRAGMPTRRPAAPGPRAWGSRRLALLILLFAGYFARAVVVPARRLPRAPARLAAGDLHRRVARTAAAELGELAAAFNAMAESLGRAETVEARTRSSAADGRARDPACRTSKAVSTRREKGGSSFYRFAELARRRESRAVRGGRPATIVRLRVGRDRGALLAGVEERVSSVSHGRLRGAPAGKAHRASRQVGSPAARPSPERRPDQARPDATSPRQAFAEEDGRRGAARAARLQGEPSSAS